jgi:hypothetical protein
MSSSGLQDILMRLSLILILMCSGYLIGSFSSNSGNDFIDFLNAALIIFDIFGGVLLLLLRIERQPRIRD